MPATRGGFVYRRPILEAMDTPDDVIDLAVLYLRIYFLGMPFFMIYNFGASILRSMGDTKRPLYCLVAAGIINTVLNLLLVVSSK
ncbi:MAG: MATE family efflux transporter [Butyricimonas faecalis]